MNLITDYQAAAFWLGVTNFAVTTGLGLYLWVYNKDRVTNGRITALETDIDARLDDHTARLVRLEQEQRHSLGHGDLEPIYERVNTISEQMSALGGEFNAVKRLLETMHRHLLESRA